MITECPHMVPEGKFIAELKPGEEIIIAAGAGNPAHEEDVKDYVLEVQGCSALTAGGIRLMCSDGNSVTKTGNQVPVEKLEVSEEARQILLVLEDPLVHSEASIWIAGLFD